MWKSYDKISLISQYNQNTTLEFKKTNEQLLHLHTKYKELKSSINPTISPVSPTPVITTNISRYDLEFKLKFDNRLFVFWMGNNELSVNRKRCLQSLNEKSGLWIILVTRENLQSFVAMTGVPLHSGYNLLAAIHKSDYLRSYFMHFFGGAYSDLKAHKQSWVPEISKTMKNASVLASGMQEIAGGTPVRSLANHTGLLISNGGFFFKPRTNLTLEWYNSVQEEMDAIYPRLLIHPGTHLNRDMEPGYPVSWAQIQGVKFHPIVYKYRDHISRNLPWIDLSNYI